MKKVLIVLCFAVSVMYVGELYAGQSNTGCGLGSIVFKGKDGLLSQTCAATFNGTSGNQTFGITSGTSNCEQFKTIASNPQINKFIADNMDNLAKDIAKGSGEYLTTLAVLMQISENERGNFYSRMQSNFSNIYSSSNVTSTDVAKSIDMLVTKG